MTVGASTAGFAEPETKRPPLLVLCGWGVHAYTATGAVCGLMALVYAAKLDFRASFIAMALATVVDSSDGPMARALEIGTLIPIFDGALLDNIVDYLTYVVAPAFLMLTAGLLPQGLIGSLLAAAVMLSSAYGFCRIDAKTEDHFFLGFPSYWNLVALYLFCFGLSPSINGLIVGGLAILVFVPMKFIYPNRTTRLRALTLTLGIIWAFATIALVFELPSPNRALVLLSFSFVIYYLLASLALQARTIAASLRF